MKIWIVILTLMVALMTASSAAAITVDGYKSPGEWDDNWAFGQENATTYDPNGPFGDRMVIRQGGLDTAVTDNWFDVYPNDTAGPTFDQSMATQGDYSGSDIMKVYARYDPVNDVMYGMTEVYGMPGDLDGNEDVTGVAPADQAGDPGPAAGTPGHPYGLGPTEFWHINIQQGANWAFVSVVNNDWSVSSNVGMDYDDADARFTFDQYRLPGDETLPKSVYEVSMSNFSTFFDMSPGATFAAEIMAGSSADIVGEEIVSVFFEVPEPDIELIKYVSGDNVTWHDANTPAAGPLLDTGQDVYWKYVITNTGNEPLVNVMLTDDQLGNITCPQDTLAIGESMECFAQGTVPEVCQPPYYYKNVGTVDAIGMASGIPVTDNDPAHYRCKDIPHNGNDVPVMTPAGLVGLVAMLGIIGIVSMRRKD
ncbi:hypothetical protein Mzhil_0296 [Methanosalsum zhilinae DSM 4017]|uniref:DUF7507 domain-containing protein n=1 Tax=Methanosalsum zhilinae (strain DSM 4017 / NBRC 107636 / OCM 62 / WeN5) TaxID=679901 RepID=F7XNY2_METZD|nr:hypothetical protein [Methanosalsum zhilinae]AEH60172.1 hypothetical protein Mzhil_0296 [Methanosalsum zhilinae DSM 4017]